MSDPTPHNERGAPVNISPGDLDAHGQWTGTCEQCGTSHEGYPPGTLGGETRCLRIRAEREGATHLVDRVDALTRDLDNHRVQRLIYLDQSEGPAR